MDERRALTACARPCGPCPWRVDNADRYRYPNLADYAANTIPGEPGFGAAIGSDDQFAAFGEMFACHHVDADPSLLCAGWLAVEGAGHPTIRLAITWRLLAADVLEAKQDWPELYDSYAAMLDTVGHAGPAVNAGQDAR